MQVELSRRLLFRESSPSPLVMTLAVELQKETKC